MLFRLWLVVTVGILDCMAAGPDPLAQADLIVKRARDRIVELLGRGEVLIPGTADLDRIGARAAEYAVMPYRRPRGRSAVADRVGPVYTSSELTEWLVGPGDRPLTTEAMRKRALKRQLVAMQTDDRHWVFPAFQFDAIGGRLVVQDDVTRLWRALPHDSWRSAATLAAWMNTQLHSMGGLTPSSYAAIKGVEDPTVTAAISRLRADAGA